jgi:hypothetical protein
MDKRTPKELPPLAPDYVIVDCKRTLEQLRTNVTPPYTTEQIEQIKRGWFLGYRFLQENGLTTRRLVSTQDDLETLVLQVKDLTGEGMRFYRTSDSPYARYAAAIGRDFTKDPQRKVQRILEPGLKKLRAEEP